MPYYKGLVLDTNFLMIPGQFRVDIFEELEKSCYFPFQLYTTSGNIDELNRLRLKGTVKDRTAANVGLGLIKAKNLKIIAIERDKGVDDALVRLSEEGYIIATVDRGLQKRLKAYAYLRQKRYIEFKGVD
ncbi:twitching motility protein PilT [Candidatus Woesearchaeota archaeon]|nr:twitching motility protein PilT [Candidatus Woesearchaeota archaeon]